MHEFSPQFYLPNTIALYALSAVLGVGAAIIWTGQGNFLTLNSDEATMSRNSGIFWAMLQLSMVIGNTFVFFQFQGLNDIDKHTRSFVVIVLLVVCCVGVITLGLLRKPPTDSGNDPSEGTVLCKSIHSKVRICSVIAIAPSFDLRFITNSYCFKHRHSL